VKYIRELGHTWHVRGEVGPAFTGRTVIRTGCGVYLQSEFSRHRLLEMKHELPPGAELCTRKGCREKF
jgi:hypothetical protein